MTDFIDQTAKREQAITDAAIRNRKRYCGVSTTHCEGCDEPIPNARRLALPGVQTCIHGASRAEGVRV